MPGEYAKDRTVLSISGADQAHFLQNLVTCDVKDPKDGLTYAALLTPQGKYLVDFFLLNQGDDILLDVKVELAERLIQRLMMYRLRADVTIERTDLNVVRGVENAPPDAWADPRDPTLGWRGYGMVGGIPQIDWNALRVAACVPETGIELIPEETYILEAGFDRLSGVDHKKGCYVGQEVTARMKHKTTLRKGLTTVLVNDVAPVGTEIMAQGRSVGTLYTQSGGRGIAYLRFDRATGPMQAGNATVTWP